MHKRRTGCDPRIIAPRLAISFAPPFLAVLAALALPAHDASACGGFFVAGGARVPSLSIERVRLAFDRPSETEHFVREIVFHNADAPFGFVVPTPAKPTVAKVEGDVWGALARRFPYPPYEPPSGGGLGAINQGCGPAVQVLSVKRVGSFTAFTLAAAVRTDGDGVAWKKPWREGRRFAGTAASEPRRLLPGIPWPGGQTLVVQTFEDQKTSRRGWGDVVLVPEKAEELGPEAIAKRRALCAVLDPSLEARP